MKANLCLWLFLSLLATGALQAAQDDQQAARAEKASAALRRAVDFFSREVATEGGYLWRYSADLSRREGEGKASPQTVWIQPPGTPAVGMALLAAYEATGETACLGAARRAGHCLVWGQLQSGGWDYRIEFDPQERKRYAYRVDGQQQRSRNVTTLDDNNTQAALRLLMRLDQTLKFEDERIHEAAQYALASLLKAQYPNGAWPQRYDSFPDPADYPVKQAGYPESWPREWPENDYRGYYTFNDNAMADVIDVMFMAARIYDADQYRQAAARCGDFLLLAQLPDPQPAWAQQYNLQMHPAWARKFEPPSVTGGESQGVMRALIRVYLETGDKKYVATLPRAIAYLRKSARPDGRLARFYELQTNKPLYFTKDYQLTYSDADMPTHYAFVVSNNLDRVERELNQALALTDEERTRQPAPRPPRLTRQLETGAEQVIAALDERGRWVEKGSLRSYDDAAVDEVIDCRTFIRNLETLAEYVAALKAPR